MASWIQAQIKGVEGIFEAVDQAVVKTVSNIQQPASSSSAAHTDQQGNAPVVPTVKPSAPSLSAPSSPFNLKTSQTYTKPGTSQDGFPTASPSAVPNIPSSAERLGVSAAPRRTSLGTGGEAEKTLGSSGSEPLPAPRPIPAWATAVADTPPPSKAADDSEAPDSSQSAATSNAREQRGTKALEQLRRKLEDSARENQQLEELLAAAEKRAEEESANAAKFREELEGVLSERSANEDSWTAALTAKDVECLRLKMSLETAQSSLAAAEESLRELREEQERLQMGRDEVEGGMLEVLRGELRRCEAQLDSERRAHQASKATAASREVDLERQLGDVSSIMAQTQRSLEEATARTRELEETVAVLQATNNQLSQELQGIEAGGGRANGAAQAAASLTALQHEVETLREDLARARSSQAAAEKARRAVESQLAATKEELGAAQEAANHASSQGTAVLEARLKEMSELLYAKQMQLERLASDKAAQQMLLERERAAQQQEAVRLRSNALNRSGGDAVIGMRQAPTHDFIPMDALGEPYQRLLRHNRLGSAVKTAARMLDSGTSTAVHVLRQYPMWRLVVFGYLLAVHLYLYFLTLRLQRIAVHIDSHLPEVHRPT